MENIVERRSKSRERDIEPRNILHVFNNPSIVGRNPIPPSISYRIDIPFGIPFYGWSPWKIGKIAAKDLYGYSNIASCYNTSTRLVFEVEGKYAETARFISEYMTKYWPFMNKYRINPYQNSNVELAAHSSVTQASTGECSGLVTCFFRGLHLRDIAVTTGRVADGINQIIGTPVTSSRKTKCHAIFKEIKIDGEKYTADLAIYTDESDPVYCWDDVNKIHDYPEYGRSVLPKLWNGEDEENLLGRKVCVVDQHGKINMGKVKRYLHFDRKLKLHNVVQVEPEGDDVLYKEGDSGGSVFLASADKSGTVDVFGMVSSKSKRFTNVTLLYKVLPKVVQNLPSLAKDGNLPLGVHFCDGLDFVEVVGNDENVDCRTFWSDTGPAASSGNGSLAFAEDDAESAASDAIGSIQPLALGNTESSIGHAGDDSGIGDLSGMTGSIESMQ